MTSFEFGSRTLSVFTLSSLLSSFCISYLFHVYSSYLFVICVQMSFYVVSYSIVVIDYVSYF